MTLRELAHALTAARVAAGAAFNAWRAKSITLLADDCATTSPDAKGYCMLLYPPKGDDSTSGPGMSGVRVGEDIGYRGGRGPVAPYRAAIGDEIHTGELHLSELGKNERRIRDEIHARVGIDGDADALIALVNEDLDAPCRG